MSVALVSIFNTTKSNVSSAHLYGALFSVMAYTLLLTFQVMNKWIVGSCLVGALLIAHIIYLYNVLTYMNYI